MKFGKKKEIIGIQTGKKVTELSLQAISLSMKKILKHV